MSAFNKVLLALLSAAILVSVAAIVYLLVTPTPSDRFTEFYLLSENGTATGYPTVVRAGTPVPVILGVVNREGKSASYNINVVSNGATLQSVQIPDLSPNQRWEEKTSFTLANPGENQTVQCYLFMNGGDKPHIKDPLTLELDVVK